MDHLQTTNSFVYNRLRFLVLDEADRYVGGEGEGNREEGEKRRWKKIGESRKQMRVK